MLDHLLHIIRSPKLSPDLVTSKLCDENTFYPTLSKDLRNCRSELLIECPFITTRRLSKLLPALQELRARKVKIIINTRDPLTNDDEYWTHNSIEAISRLQDIGVEVFYTNGHHRKLVVIDRAILYEGSLNILSQNDSSEIMRRIESVSLACEMIRFVGVDSYVA